MSFNTYTEYFFQHCKRFEWSKSFIVEFSPSNSTPRKPLSPHTPETVQVFPVAIKFSLPLGVICETLHIYKYMTCKYSKITNCILMVVMHIFSFYWVFCNFVTFTSVLSYSEKLLQISFVQNIDPTKQAIKYNNFVKQHKYTHTNSSVRHVFRTQLNVYNGAILRKQLTALRY